MALPDFELVFLRRVYRPTDDLKDIRGSAAVAVLHAHGNADYRSGTEVSGRTRRNRGDEPAVRQASCSNFDWFEQARERATCADGIHEIALRKHNRFAGGQVRGHNCQRNAQVLELSRLEHPLDQILQALIAGQAEARNAPTGDVPEAELAASLNNVRERCTTGVGSAQDAPHTGSCDVRDGNVVLFEDLQNTQVGEATRETSAKSKADACLPGHRGCTFVQCFAHRMPVPRHARRIAGSASLILWVARPERAVLLYWGGNLACFSAASLNSTNLLVRCPLCTIVGSGALRDSLFRQIAESLREPTRMDSAFKAWVGQPVVLQVALGDIKVPLRGKLLKDGDDTVRMRIGDGWDVDIYKAMILAVEEDSMVLLPA